MKIESKVAWSRGLLMLPQHLQQLDRYHEALLAARIDALDPLAYGVLAVELDDHALREAKPQVQLRRFEGVLPDGTVLSIGDGQGGHGAPDPVPIKPGDMPPDGAPLSIYLGAAREGLGNNYGQDGSAAGLRYRVLEAEVPDRAASNRTDRVKLAVPGARLFAGEQSAAMASYDTLKVAEVVHQGGGLAFSESYIPPCIRISAAPALLERIQRLRARMMERHDRLMERRREAADGRIEYTAVDVTRFLQLHAINSMLPTVHYLGSTGDVSPRFAFLTLTQLVGQLATFSPDVDMKQPLPLRFDDLRGSFERVLELAEELLQLTDQQLYVACPLEYRDGLFQASVKDPRLQGGRRYLLAIKSDIEPEKLILEVEKNARIANAQFIVQLRRSQTSGVPATAIRDGETDPDRQLPPQVERQRGWVYFNIPLANQHTVQRVPWESYWTGIWRTGELRLELDSQLAPRMQIKLLRVLEGRGG